MSIMKTRQKGVADLRRKTPAPHAVMAASALALTAAQRKELHPRQREAWDHMERSYLLDQEKKRRAAESPVEARRWGLGYSGPILPDKGKANGSCNRTACQYPLADEPVHQFMDGNFTGGPRLHYCAKCAADFDDWDHRSGDRIRIRREPKVCESV